MLACASGTFPFTAVPPSIFDGSPRTLPAGADKAGGTAVKFYELRDNLKPIAAQPLIDEFRRTPSDQQGLKWAIGNALDVVTDNSVLPELLEFAQDQSHGAARQMIVTRLGRGPKRPEIAETLVSLLEDEDVALHAMSALRQQLGPEEARAYVARLEDHPSEKIRGQARQAIKKIDRALAKKPKRR